MILDISHRTTFKYDFQVAMSQHLVHLSPRETPVQVVHSHSLTVDPAPALRSEDVDYFGNTTNYLTIDEPHDELRVVSRARIEVSTPVLPPPETTEPWDKVSCILGQNFDRSTLDAYSFVFGSPLTLSQDALAYAEPSFPTGSPVLYGAIDLMGRIYRDFKYEGGVTDISTPVDRLLADRRGVCQDFAHLQIACLRALGLPARYVSGYLLTHPPEGQERLVGSDASHAWLAVWVPEYGWVDLDPTNNLLPAEEHITIAWGRDYGDVSPINGMVIGGGEHKVDVAVDVRPAMI